MRYRVEVLGDSPLSGTILDLQIELPTVEDDFKKQSSSFDELERHLQVATSASLPIAQEAFNQLKESGQEIFFGASLTWKLVTWTYELAMSGDGSISVGAASIFITDTGGLRRATYVKSRSRLVFLGIRKLCFGKKIGSPKRYWPCARSIFVEARNLYTAVLIVTLRDRSL